MRPLHLPHWLARPSLTTRLFAAWLMIGLGVALAMGLAVRMNFEQGFHGYVDARDAERTQAWTRALETAYREHGSWDFLISDRTAWWRLMVTTARHASSLDGIAPPPDLGEWPPLGFMDPEATGLDGAPTGDQPPLAVPPPAPQEPPSGAAPVERSFGGRTPSPGGPRPVHPRWDGTPSGHDRPGSPPRPPSPPPMALLDVHQQVVAGHLPPNDEAAWHALHNNGQVIGWLVTARPLPGRMNAIDRGFQDTQTRAVMTIGLVVAMLAGGLGWAVARRLLAPVRHLAQATDRLAQGDYTARVQDERSDEIGRLATGFNRLAQALDQHERSRRALLADVSHELRTPLAVLRGEIEALQDGVRTATPAALESLLGEVAALSRLVDDVHDLAAADTGQWSYVMAPLDLGSLLGVALDRYAERFAAHDLRLERPALITGPQAWVLGDARRLEQLVRNLLENAVRYTDPGGRVEVSLRVDDDRAVLTVQDSAPGVSPEQLPRLFERFYRTEASRSRAHGGSGLGLALCRQIVVAHRGTIEASTSPLGGVRITVELPGGAAAMGSAPDQGNL